MNNTNTPTDMTATLTAKYYAIEVTFTQTIFGTTTRSENIRLQYNGRKAFPGRTAKDVFAKWEAGAAARGIKVESMQFVAI